MSRTTIAIAVLTMGERGDELRSLAAAACEQSFDERLVVANGCADPELPGWQTTATDRNIGVPGGRSLAMQATTADVVVFIDDDAQLSTADLADRVRGHFEAEPRLGALALRLVVTGSGTSIRRWIPQHRKRPDGSSLARCVTYPGGGHALRRTAVLEVGGHAADLFFKHEETELSWRLLDAGWDLAFDEECIVEHPATAESRHPDAFRLGMRNKLWLARAQLPRALVAPAIMIAVLRYLSRVRSFSHLQAIRQGIGDGFGATPGQRSPMTWKTVWLLSRRGRPPIL